MGPRELPEATLRAPGTPLGPPGATLTIGMLALGGLGGGLGRSKNRPRLIFERSKGVKVLRLRVSSMFTLWI